MTELPTGYRLTEDRREIDVAAAHAFLRDSYWGKGLERETLETAVANSLCVAILHGPEQVAFARVISDYATFAYLADVYVLDDHRGKGLATAMLEHLYGHPRLQGLRRWLLFTLDAQPLYRKAGWDQYLYPERVMIRGKQESYE